MASVLADEGMRVRADRWNRVFCEFSEQKRAVLSPTRKLRALMRYGEANPFEVDLYNAVFGGTILENEKEGLLREAQAKLEGLVTTF